MNIKDLDLNTFASRLKFIRINKNLSQEQMAEKIGVSLSSYKSYEHAKTTISIDTAQAIVKKFNISLDFLILGMEYTTIKKEIISTIQNNIEFDTNINNGNIEITATIPFLLM